ncbi:hypothetical protein [Mycolicibacterium fortuitum]|uniref:hypothetical protein n=1 Tax=Mycolicibacterium fortuitum TaxID=1766 RepID=UPI0007EA27F8|nr:hypothetical protein [Mycolicibacterium fortuitum]OBF77040.1 hypothetical protein A5751_22945 [Mycolicibacterium fortuitum]
MNDAQKLIAEVIAAHQEFVVSLEEDTLPSYLVRCQGNGEVDGCAWDTFEFTYDFAVAAFNAHVAAEIDKALEGLTRETPWMVPPDDKWTGTTRWVSGWTEAHGAR